MSQWVGTSRWVAGDRVVFLSARGIQHRGSVERVLEGGRWYRVRFDEGQAPDWPQIRDNACHFYGGELSPEL